MGAVDIVFTEPACAPRNTPRLIIKSFHSPSSQCSSLFERETVCASPEIGTFQTILQALRRIVFSEYHAAGSPTGAYMLRKGKYKFIYYVDYSPELFDLEINPEETMNLANNNEYKKIVKEYEGLVRDICDPEAVNRKAKEDQNILIEKFGGREKAFSMGTPGASPVPG